MSKPMKYEKGYPGSSWHSSKAEMENEIDDNGVPKTDSKPSKHTNRKKQKKPSEKNKTEGKSDDKTNNDDATEKPSGSPQFSKPKPSSSTAADHNFFEENSAADASKADEAESNTPRTRSDAAANDNVATPANRTGSLSNLSQNALLLLMVSFLYIFGQIRGISGMLTVPPVNVLAKSGTVVRLRCSTDLTEPVYWRRHLYGASQTQEVLYYGNLGFSSSVNGRFKMDQSRGQGSYDVIISNVTAADAGVYVCQDGGGMGDKREMELVVFEYFNCTMPMPPVGFMEPNDIAVDEIRATCRVKYYGNQKLRFHWRWSVDAMVVSSTDSVSGSTMINSTAVTRPRMELNGAQLTCTATVSSDGSDAAEDSAVEWTSPQVTVLPASLQPGNAEQCKGSSVILVCNSECEYLEAQLNNGLCQCVATYKSSQDQRDFAFSVYSCAVADSSRNTSIYLILACIVGVALVISAIAATAFLIRKYKGNRNPEDKEKQPVTDGSPESSQNMIDSSESSVQSIPEVTPLFLEPTVIICD